MKLSIITINKNNKAGLEKTTQSILEQSYPHIEQIIIDGGSTDGSVDVIKSFTDIPSGTYTPKPNLQIPHVSYWVSKPDSGIYHAMNKGVSQANGQYCLFLNSGDYLIHENALSNLFSYKFTEDIVYANQERVGNNGAYVIEYPEKLTFFHFFAEYLGHNSTLIKRNLFSDIGYYNELNRVVSDWEFLMLAICKHNRTCRHLPVVFSAAVNGGISNHEKYRHIVQAERNAVLEKHFPLFIEDYEKLFNLEYNTPFKRMKRRIKKRIRR